MSKLLDHALTIVRGLTADAQDDIARLLLRLASDGDEASTVTLSPEEHTAIAASKRAAARGEFASEAQVREVWAKHGL